MLLLPLILAAWGKARWEVGRKGGKGKREGRMGKWGMKKGRRRRGMKKEVGSRVKRGRKGRMTGERRTKIRRRRRSRYNRRNEKKAEEKEWKRRIKKNEVNKCRQASCIRNMHHQRQKINESTLDLLCPNKSPYSWQNYTLNKLAVKVLHCLYFTRSLRQSLPMDRRVQLGVGFRWHAWQPSVQPLFSIHPHRLRSPAHPTSPQNETSDAAS